MGRLSENMKWFDRFSDYQIYPVTEKKHHNFWVKPTSLNEHKSHDFIVTLDKSGRQKLGIGKKEYVILENNAKPNSRDKKFCIIAYAMDDDNEDILQNDKGSEQSLQIGVDQTLREALCIKEGDELKVFSINEKYEMIEGLIPKRNFQKDVVRVRQNLLYKEHKTPIVCLCDEMITSIGAYYGDRIHVESITPITNSLQPVDKQSRKIEKVGNSSSKVEGYKIKKITVKCAKLDKSMEKIHDEDSKEGIHSIFMDEILRNQLDVCEGYPIRIRRSWGWETVKKFNKFGNVSLLAFSVILASLIEHPNLSLLWPPLFFFLGWGAWSILTSSRFGNQAET